MKSIKEQFEEEVQNRIDIKKEDPHCVEDHGDMTDAEWRTEALEDMRDMGPDYGGAFTEGICPTHLKADGSIDHDAMRRQEQFIADMRRQRKEWCAIRKLAMRELSKSEAADVS